MTLPQLEQIRDSIKMQLETHMRSTPAPGQDTLWHINVIELRTAIRTVEQIITVERTALMAPPGATGPVLVGV